MAAIQYRFEVLSFLEYLDLNNYHEAARTLERESGLFFSLPYFEESFIHGAFDEAEEYFNGFTTVHDNTFSTSVVFELRWHKFMEALHENKRDEAETILHEELHTFDDKNVIARATEILSLEDFRSSMLLREYGHPTKARSSAMSRIRIKLEANPKLLGKIRCQIPNSTSNVRGGGLVNRRFPPPPPLPAAPPVPPPPAVAQRSRVRGAPTHRVGCSKRTRLE